MKKNIAVLISVLGLILLSFVICRLFIESCHEGRLQYESAEVDIVIFHDNSHFDNISAILTNISDNCTNNMSDNLHGVKMSYGEIIYYNESNSIKTRIHCYYNFREIDTVKQGYDYVYRYRSELTITLSGFGNYQSDLENLRILVYNFVIKAEPFIGSIPDSHIEFCDSHHYEYPEYGVSEIS